MILLAKNEESRRDTELQRRVESYLVRQQFRALRDVTVEASSGTVVLRGEVQSFYEKQLCLNCSKRVAGVIELVDEILVK